MIGTRLAHYEITAHLGSGGMGDVYQATDLKLKRSVAIKILPEGFASDGDRLSRFRREAQLLASLNQPNIAHIYGLEETRDWRCIVMELVEGETLQSRIKRGPMACDEALAIAKQICDALEAAHEKGVIHRDLKPGNVMLTGDGKVKVLDFGLAKAVESEIPNLHSSNTPTIMAGVSIPGLIVGTVAYMSPEQAKGRKVDRRSDIFAFGCVLYEMLTGRRAFDGEDPTEILSAVVRMEPDWSQLPAEVPAAIRKLLQLCLEKNARNRRSDAADVRLDIEQALVQPSGALPGSEKPTVMPRRERLMWAAAVTVLLVIAAAIGLRSALQREAAAAVVRFEVFPPEGGDFTRNLGVPRFAISPDGRYLVFSATPGPGKPDQLWLRRLDSTEAKPIAGTESADGSLLPQFPFWSPDSRSFAFFVQDGTVGNTFPPIPGNSKTRLKKVDLQGGGVQTLCELPSNGASGSWNSDGVILVSTLTTGGLLRIPATGGVPTQVTTLDKSLNETAHLFPYFLPDGHHFLYQVQTTNRENWAIYLGSVDSSDRKMLVRSEGFAQFALPNHVLYVHGDSLLSQDLDLKTLALTGEPTLVANNVGTLSNGRSGFSVSTEGILVYHSSLVGRTSQQLVWVDRTGKPVESLGTPTAADNLRLSRDGKHVALDESIVGASGPISIYDIDRGLKTPLITDAAGGFFTVWSSDGTKLIFSSSRDRRGKEASLYEKQSNGAMPEQQLLATEPGISLTPQDESADGSLLVFTRGILGQVQLWAMPLSGDRKPFQYLPGSFDQPQAALSPNGRWLAYTSNESGRYQVAVQPFPNPSGGKWQISVDGGDHPRWRRDGRELYFISGGLLEAVSVAEEGDFEVGKSTPLFKVPFPLVENTSGYRYDVAADGQHILVLAPAANPEFTRAAPLTVTLNRNSTVKP